MLAIAVSLLTAISVSAQPGFGTAEKINANWRFHLGDIDLKKEPDQRDRSWRTVQLPHDWTIKQTYSPTYASATGYLPGGIGWYQKKLNITKLRIFATGSNLFTWDKFKIYDPEIPDGFGSYPQQKLINFGLNVTL